MGRGTVRGKFIIHPQQSPKTLFIIVFGHLVKLVKQIPQPPDNPELYTNNQIICVQFLPPIYSLLFSP